MFYTGMNHPKYQSITGIVTDISNFMDNGCSKLFRLQDVNGAITEFVIAPNTFFINQEVIAEGMQITCFYDAIAPAVLIYPPRYQAIVVSRNRNGRNVVLDHFGPTLVSQSGMLKLNLSPNTIIELENGQPFIGSIENRDLIVLYTTSTRSIPAQTTPQRIIVLCR